jgi:hypothetical protein
MQVLIRIQHLYYALRICILIHIMIVTSVFCQICNIIKLFSSYFEINFWFYVLMLGPFFWLCFKKNVTLCTRVQWFWHFFTCWGITTHPWHPKGPRIWKLAKKNFQLHPWPAEIFGKKRKMRFFGLVSKFNFRSPVWQIFTIFSACFIYGVLNTRTKC